MMFQKVEKREFGGRSLIAYLSGVTVNNLRSVFGSPVADAYWDDEAGYDGTEWAFQGSDGRVVTVYARWGEPRIGGVDLEDAVLLVAWLRENGLPGAGLEQVDMDAYLAGMRAHAAVNAMMQEI